MSFWERGGRNVEESWWFLSHSKLWKILHDEHACLADLHAADMVKTNVSFAQNDHSSPITYWCKTCDVTLDSLLWPMGSNPSTWIPPSLRQETERSGFNSIAAQSHLQDFMTDPQGSHPNWISLYWVNWKHCSHFRTSIVNVEESLKEGN